MKLRNIFLWGRTYRRSPIMPISYLVYGSGIMLVISLIIYIFSRKRPK